MNSPTYLAERKQRVEQLLVERMPAENALPQRLHQAMRYAVLNGGKRLRPLLVYAAGETFGAALEQLDPAACAVELIHAYSLVHDDLPAMDNDDWRRGQPTCHKAFDEATAVLVGDALQTLAFSCLAEMPALNIQATQRVAWIKTLVQASGSFGMAGGQALEFQLKDTQESLTQWETISKLKTGALIQASVELAAISAGVNEQAQQRLINYAACLGLAFQIQDDIQDAGGEQEKHQTWVMQVGVETAKQKIQVLYDEALQAVSIFGSSSRPLVWMADYILNKNSK